MRWLYGASGKLQLLVRRLRQTPYNSPFQNRARPSEPAAEHDHQNVIAALDPAAAIRFVECDGYGRSRGIAVAIQIHKHFVARYAETFCDSLEDAQICLVRNDTGDVFNGKASLVEGLFGCVQHRDDRLFVHFLAGHVDRCQMHVRIFTSDGAPRTAAGHEQNICVPAVAADMSADYTVSTASVAQNSRAGAVSKKDAGVAIGPIRDRCQFLCTDYEDRVVCVRGD